MRFLLITLALVFTASAPAEELTSVYLRRLMDEAVAKHPKMEAAAARSEAALASIHAVRLWQDPELGLGGMAADVDMRREDGDVMLNLDQELPRPGLFRAERRRATAEQERMAAETSVKALELSLAVAQTAIDLALADETLRLQEQEVAWLEEIVKTAQDRAKNPDATAADPLRLESELAVRNQKWQIAKRQRAQLARTLNLLLLRETESPWGRLSLPPVNGEVLSAEALRAQMEARNPRLAALRHEVEAASAGVDAAKQRRKPMFSVGLESTAYADRGDVRTGTLMVKMSLPWLNRSGYNAEIAQAEYLRRAAQNDADAEAREFLTTLNALITEAENNASLARAYRDEVLPKSAQSVESLESAWLTNKATLTEVLDARRADLEARQELQRAIAAHQGTMWNLRTLTGG